MTAMQTEPTIDLEELREKYRFERDRRLRPDGARQYRGTRGAFGYWARDPYTRTTSREPRHDAVEVLVIGGGFGGLLTAAKLRDAGFDSVRVTDEAGDFGGTWYWNRYPGVHCDIEASVYLPLLEEVGTSPTRRYAPGAEIRAHAVRIARHYGLYDDALLHTRITELRWDEADLVWHVRTDRDDHMRARYVVVSSGTLTQPKLPAIPGFDRYRGHTFHTSRWDYAYTGGDETGGLVGLRDKRVAVVGTGATGVQVIPKVAKDAKHLVVLQRTPSSVDVRDNRDLPEGWTDGLPAGWQQHRMDNFLETVSGEEPEVDLIDDGWTATARLQRQMLTGASRDDLSPEERERLDEIADAAKMDAIRQRVDEIVVDADTAAKLKPWYRYMCKRPTFSDEYLPAFNRANVTLVDTADTGGITAMSENGVLVGDREYEVDCVIFATGFETGVSGVVSGSLPVIGAGGMPLLSAWAQGPRTLHGMTSHGFPNLFHLGSFQNANSVNFVHILQEQAVHIAAVLAGARTSGAARVEPSAAAQDAWAATIREVEVDNGRFLEACTPGYYNGEGSRLRGGGGYGPGPVRFHRLLREWRDVHMGDVLVPQGSRSPR